MGANAFTRFCSQPFTGGWVCCLVIQHAYNGSIHKIFRDKGIALWWFGCKMPPTGSGSRSLGPQLVVLFGGSHGALLEEGCHWKWALRVYGLATSASLSLFCVSLRSCDLSASCSSLPLPCSIRHYGLSLWNRKTSSFLHKSLLVMLSRHGIRKVTDTVPTHHAEISCPYNCGYRC